MVALMRRDITPFIRRVPSRTILEGEEEEEEEEEKETMKEEVKEEK